VRGFLRLASRYARRRKELTRERCWRLISQRAVRPFLVELLLPRGDLPPRVPQILEPTHVQTLIPQLAVETFHIPVLLQLSRLDVHQLDASLDAPCQKMPTGELRRVVTANREWSCPIRQNSLQRPRHASAREAGIHFQRQTFPRALAQRPIGPL
jgi:hypothetical protein